jgi:hypothetical protein
MDCVTAAAAEVVRQQEKRRSRTGSKTDEALSTSPNASNGIQATKSFATTTSQAKVGGGGGGHGGQGPLLPNGANPSASSAGAVPFGSKSTVNTSASTPLGQKQDPPTKKQGQDQSQGGGGPSPQEKKHEHSPWFLSPNEIAAVTAALESQLLRKSLIPASAQHTAGAGLAQQTPGGTKNNPQMSPKLGFPMMPPLPPDAPSSSPMSNRGGGLGKGLGGGLATTSTTSSSGSTVPSSSGGPMMSPAHLQLQHPSSIHKVFVVVGGVALFLVILQMHSCFIAALLLSFCCHCYLNATSWPTLPHGQRYLMAV